VTARIEWTASTHTEVGRAGGIRLFEITWGVRRDNPRPWKLRSTLPVKFTYPGGASKDDAKAHAEKILTAFVEKIGATFPA
jgi:hypothetical protein